ncbi:sensor histidine kinase [Nocardiopsis tropica]|uniref:histidine kinase n=1 Tax=Nocardiopsis tropica TaxID=109330 RepID=A0ABV1ZW11_9ACTN
MSSATDVPPAGPAAPLTASDAPVPPAPRRPWPALRAEGGPTPRRFAADAAASLVHLALAGGLPDPRDLGADDPLPWARLALSALITAGILLRWRLPAASFCTVLAATLAALAAGWTAEPFTAAAWTLYPLALTSRHGSFRPRHWAYLLGALLVLVAAGVDPVPLEEPVRALVVGAVLLALSWLLGRSVRELREQEERAVAAVEREARTRERLRVAREVHDVVSHTLGAIGMRAGVARYAGGDAEELRSALADIEEAGREASNELRRVLGALRADADAPLEPQPGLDGLAALADTARRTGIDCRLEVSGVEGVPPAVAVSVYRIVREAVTNVIRHAPGGSCSVVVTGEGDAVEAEVTDTGPARGRVGSPGGGVGMVGMRERVAVHGGTLTAGPLPGGGFRVRARVPSGPGG